MAQSNTFNNTSGYIGHDTSGDASAYSADDGIGDASGGTQYSISNEDIQSTVRTVLEKMGVITSQFVSVLEDFTKHYILHHKNPEVDEYTTAYNDNKSQLQELQKGMFNIDGYIGSSTDKINEIKAEIEGKLEEHTDKIESLEVILDSLSPHGDKEQVMKDDLVILYDYQYLKNVCMFIGILILFALFGSLFGAKLNGAISGTGASAVATSSMRSSSGN